MCCVSVVVLLGGAFIRFLGLCELLGFKAFALHCPQDRLINLKGPAGSCVLVTLSPGFFISRDLLETVMECHSHPLREHEHQKRSNRGRARCQKHKKKNKKTPDVRLKTKPKKVWGWGVRTRTTEGEAPATTKKRNGITGQSLKDQRRR